jgi:general secretion pathway protein D
LLQEEDRRTRVTMPWIGDWPLIGKLLSSYRTDRITTEVILTITPHIAQPTFIPDSGNQTFWSGTEFNYATNPVFPRTSKRISASMGSDDGQTFAHGGAMTKGNGQPNAARSLAHLATPDPLLMIKPEESIVQSGKEIRISVVDGRISASDESTFKLGYDSDILQFKRLDNAELIDTDMTATRNNVGQTGTITFHFVRPARHSPRTMNVVFVAKAPGVSPIRAELINSGNAVQAPSEVVGTGVVRVR